MATTRSSIHDVRGWRVSTYTGWDHKWDLLVIESVHDIWVIGGLQYLGGGGGVRFKATALGSLCGSLENTRKLLRYLYFKYCKKNVFRVDKITVRP